ncbi:MAG: hypothetical protein AB8U44_02085 [Aaplasma endosymbiont of Hyalomma asiaticum]
MVLDDLYAASVASSCDNGCGILEMNRLPLVISDHWESDSLGEEGLERSYLSYRDESEGLVKSLSLNFTKKDDGTYRLHDMYMNVYNAPEAVDEQPAGAAHKYYSKSNYLGGVLVESLQPVEGSDVLVKLKDLSGCDITLSLHGRAPSAEEGKKPLSPAEEDLEAL